MDVAKVLEKQRKEMERIGAEEKKLSGLENAYRENIKSAESMKGRYGTIGSRLLAGLSKTRAEQMRKTVSEQDNIISKMGRELQRVEKRKNEIAKLQIKMEGERMQAEATARKVMTRITAERAEIQREQQRGWEMREKMDRTGQEFGSTRLIKRKR